MVAIDIIWSFSKKRFFSCREFYHFDSREKILRKVPLPGVPSNNVNPPLKLELKDLLKIDVSPEGTTVSARLEE